jgi:hypothetical protein
MVNNAYAYKMYRLKFTLFKMLYNADYKFL